MQKSSLTPESARALIEKIERLRKEGMPLKEAAQECGSSVHVFGYWKSKLKVKRTYQRRKGIKVEAAPMPHVVAQFVLFSDGNIANLNDLKRAA